MIKRPKCAFCKKPIMGFPFWIFADKRKRDACRGCGIKAFAAQVNARISEGTFYV